MRIFWTSLLLVISVSVSAQSFVLKSDLSDIAFSIKNFGLPVKGKFHDASGEFFLDELNPSASHFEASVDTESIDTGIKLRDRHLRAANYFDAEHFPKIQIKSKQVSRRGNQWTATIWITIKSIIREAEINFTLDQVERGCVLTSAFTINRLDFEVGGNNFSLADDVEVQLHVMGLDVSQNP